MQQLCNILKPGLQPHVWRSDMKNCKKFLEKNYLYISSKVLPRKSSYLQIKLCWVIQITNVRSLSAVEQSEYHCIYKIPTSPSPARNFIFRSTSQHASFHREHHCTPDPNSDGWSSQLCTLLYTIFYSDGEDLCQPPTTHPGIRRLYFYGKICGHPADNNSRDVPLDSASKRVCDTERSGTVLEQIGKRLCSAPS